MTLGHGLEDHQLVAAALVVDPVGAGSNVIPRSAAIRSSRAEQALLEWGRVGQREQPYLVGRRSERSGEP